MEKYDESSNYSYCLGSSLVIEALYHIPEYIDKIYLSPKYNLNENYELLDSLCEKHHISKIFDQKIIDKLSVKKNCYAIAIFKKYHKELSDDNHILLYNFDSYGDLGTIMRSAVSFNFKNIILIGKQIDYFDPLCIRASMGSIFQLNIKYYQTIEDYLKDYDYNLYPFISNGKEFNKELLNPPYALLIPHKYQELDDLYKDGYTISNKDISLSSLSSIIFHECFNR